MYNEFKKVNEQSYHVNVRSGFVYNGVFPLLFLVANIGTTIVVYFGGLDVLDRSITPGDWFLFVQSIGILWLPLTSIASFWSQFQLGLSASERVFALIDAEPRVRQIDQQPVQRLAGRHRVQRCVFPIYRSTDRAGRLQPDHQSRRDRGPCGTYRGRQIQPRQAGRPLLRVPGRAPTDRWPRHSHLRPASYHRHLGIVPQVPFLFSGTVTDNIRYARPDATDEEVADVATAHRRGRLDRRTPQWSGYRGGRGRKSAFHGAATACRPGKSPAAKPIHHYSR